MTTLLAGLLLCGWVGVFRNVEVGKRFPDLPVVGLDGKERTWKARGESPAIVAFVRGGHTPSQNVLRAITRAASNTSWPKSTRILIVHLRGPLGGIGERGLPRSAELVRDHGAAKAVGLVVSPSVAVLDRRGVLRRAYVLDHEQLSDWLLADLTSGKARDAEAAAEAKLAARRSNALALERRGEFREALQALVPPSSSEQALAPEDRILAARLHVRLGEPAKAIAILTPLLEDEPSADVRLWLARAHLDAGHLEIAREQLTTLAPDTPEPGVVHRLLAEVERRAGNLDRALAHARAAYEALRGGR